MQYDIVWPLSLALQHHVDLDMRSPGPFMLEYPSISSTVAVGDYIITDGDSFLNVGSRMVRSVVPYVLSVAIIVL